MIFFVVLSTIISIANLWLLFSLKCEMEHIKEAFFKLTEILNLMASKMGAMSEYNGIVKFVNTLMTRIECKCNSHEDINS